MAGGAWFVYRLGLRLLDADFALTLAFAYLLYPALLFVALFEFHPVALAVFFLLGALEAFERQSLRPFLIFLCLALACQEDVSLVVAALGIYGLLRRRPLAWSLVPLGLGAGLFSLSALFLMPRWNPGTVNFWLLYSHLGQGFSEILGFVLTHPLRTFSMMVEGTARKVFIINLLVPLGFLPLLDPKSFLLTFPSFFEQLLSRRGFQNMLYFHYTALLIPFLFFAALHGLRVLLRMPFIAVKRTLLQILLISLALLSTVTTGSFGTLQGTLRETRSGLLDAKRQQLVQSIPADASVVTTFEFLPRLTNRLHLYSLHHICIGRYTLSRKTYDIPQGIDRLLVDFNDPLTISFIDGSENADKRLAQFLEGWRIREAFGDLVCFERGESASLIRTVADFSASQNIHVQIEDAFTLLGFTGFSGRGKEEGILPLTFFWECLKPTPKQYGLLFEFLDGKKRVIARNYHSIGYRIYPTFRWKKGERLEEVYSLVLPKAAQGESSYELRISYVDERAQRRVPITSQGVEGEDISFGMIEVTGG